MPGNEIEEIYRGIDKNAKEFIYGDLIHKAEKIYIGYWTDNADPSKAYKECEVIPKSVGKYSGVSDIKGNGIFQGDKVEVKWSKNADTAITDIIAFRNGSFILRDKQSLLSNYSYRKIIGYEYPKLLEG